MGIVSCLLSVLTGLGLIASFPPFDFFPLAWISLVPLFLAIRGQSIRRSFALAFIAMLVFFLETLHWLSVFGWPAWIMTAIFQALFPAVWGSLVSPFFRGRRASFFNILFPPLSFTAMEAVRNLGSFGMPWGDLAYSQWRFAPIVQMASLAGSLGITFVLVLANVFIYYAWIQKDWKFCAAAVLCFAVPFLWGKTRLHETFANSPKVEMAVVQTNDYQTLKWDAAYYREMLKDLDRLVRQAGPGRADLVFLPETALVGYLASDHALQSLVQSWTAELSTPLAVGTLLRLGRHPQNAVVLFNEKGEWKQTYAKIKLVPFGEYLPLLFQPFLGKWHWLDQFVKYVPEDFVPGNEPTIFHLDDKDFGVMICFESSFGWMARALAVRGAKFLAVSTNDAWFLGTPAQETHAAMAVFRSVETGRSSIQAGNTGISLMTDPLGRVLTWVKPNQSAVVFGAIPLASTLTPYDRYGDAFAYTCIGLTVVMALYHVSRRGRPQNGDSPWSRLT